MTHGVLARRYATALFDLTSASGTTDRTLSELSALQDLIHQNAELRHVLENAAVPPASRRAVVEALSTRLELGPEVARLMALLAERDRFTLLPEITSAFTDRLMAERRIVSADATTAVPLGEAGRRELAAALGHAAGCDVTLRERVDPAIVGGLIAQVGSLVFDASLTRQLERIKERLLADA